MLIITDINKIDINKWSMFVQNHPNGNVFQTFGMYNVYKNTPKNNPVIIIAEDQGEIKGVLLANIVFNGPKFLKFLSARCIVTGGPIVENDDTEITNLLLGKLREILPGSVVYSEIRPIYDPSVFVTSFENLGFERHGHYNVIIKLDTTEEELFKRLRKERRKHVSQALRAELSFEQVYSQEDVDKIIELIEETYRRKKVPLSNIQLFINVKNYLPENVHFFAIKDGEEIVAGQIALCYNSMAYAWYTGSSEKSLRLRPNDLLMWSFINWSNSEGYKLFDFGGGGEPSVPYGVRDYKMTFGAELFDYGRFVKLHKPIIYKLAKFGLSLFKKN